MTTTAEQTADQSIFNRPPMAVELSVLDEPVSPSDAPSPQVYSDVRRFSVKPFWLLAAILSIVALWMVAPSGLYLLAFLGVIIVSHEAGHFFAARAAGMRPTEFFWGFGPEVFVFERGGCRYGLRVLFLGGYVRLEGMTPDAELPDGFGESGTYRAASISGRFATIVAGPAVNLVTGFVAASAAGLLSGRGPVEAMRWSLSFMWQIVAATISSLWVLMANFVSYVQAVFGDTGEAPVRYLSPVTQAQLSGEAVSAGLAMSLYWFALLAIAVGIVNLVPMPPLDGAHAAGALWEGARAMVTGRRTMVDIARWIPVAYVTVAVLMFLTVTSLIMDLRDLSVIGLISGQ